MTRFKVCCIESLAEARLAREAGADLLGLVSAMPSGPGVIDESLIAEIAAAQPQGVSTVLLTQETEPEAIVAQHGRCQTAAIQLVKICSVETHRTLARALPGVPRIQVLHVSGPEALFVAQGLAAHFDALLLDSGRPDDATPTLGGTGQTHDWSVSRTIVGAVDVPVWLAGGLKPENVREAVESVGPHGVDVCSGVRTDGALDGAKLLAFGRALSAARPPKDLCGGD